MLEKVEQRQKEVDANMQEQRQQLQAEQDDLASWKADAQRQLDMQQVCFDACALLSWKSHCVRQLVYLLTSGYNPPAFCYRPPEQAFGSLLCI